MSDPMIGAGELAERLREVRVLDVRGTSLVPSRENWQALERFMAKDERCVLLAATTPLAGIDPRTRDASSRETLAQLYRLRAAGRIKVTLRRAITQLEMSRVANARGERMAQHQDAAWLGKFGERKRLGRERSAREKGKRSACKKCTTEHGHIMADYREV